MDNTSSVIYLSSYKAYILYSEFQVHSTKIGGPALKRGQFYPKTLHYGGGGGRGEGGGNIFQIYILCVVYIPSFRFLAPKLGVQPSKRGNFTPKTLRYGGEGAGGGEEGKYFSNLYSKWSLHTEFQLSSTIIVARPCISFSPYMSFLRFKWVIVTKKVMKMHF